MTNASPAATTACAFTALPPNGREVEEAPKSFATGVLLEGILFAVTPLFLALLVLFSVPFAKILDTLPWGRATATQVTIIVGMTAVVVLCIAHLAKETLPMWLGALDHFARRAICLLPASLNETNRTPAISQRFLFVIAIAIAAAAAFGWVHVVIDGSPTGFHLTDILRGNPRDFSTIWLAIQGAYMFAATILLIVLPFRMVLAKSWQSLLWRRQLRITCTCSAAPRDAKRPTYVVAHASDLHAQVPGRPLTESTEPIDPTAVSRLFTSIAGAGSDIDAVVLSGDLTDDGSLGAWNSLLGNEDLFGMRDKVVIAPGNHDLNLLQVGRRASVGRVEGLGAKGPHQRAVRYLRVADRVMGDRTRLLCPYTSRLSTLREVLQRAEPDLQRWDQKLPPRREALLPQELLDRCFPMCVQVGSLPFEFVVWNSVKANRWPVFNSIGEVDTAQLERASTIVSGGSVGARVHVMHHQLGLPEKLSLKSRSGRSGFGGIGMVLSNASSVLHWLAARCQRTVILHGHHHKFFVVEEPDALATIVSAPSGTQGCEESYSDGLVASRAGSWLRLRLAVNGAHMSLEGVSPVEVPAGTPEVSTVSG